MTTFTENTSAKVADFPFFVLANKMDLSSQRQVDQKIIDDFLEMHPKVKYF